MRLAVDIGNTNTKAVRMDNGTVKGFCTGAQDEVLRAVAGSRFDEVVLSSVGEVNAGWKALAEEKGASFSLFPEHCELPFEVAYATPETLGPDRLAAAVGAVGLIGEGQGCVVIDAGSCITIDYVDAGRTFQGGVILPGLDMRFRALHTFTAKLPLLSVNEVKEWPELVGKSTAECMLTGVLNAAVFEIDAFVARLSAQGEALRVMVTGGSAQMLASKLACKAEAVDNLVIRGLCSVKTSSADSPNRKMQ